MTISEAIKKGMIELKNKNIEEPKLKSRLLMQSTLNKTRQYVIVNDMEELEKNKEKQYFSAIKILKKGIPIEHITHQKEFMKLNFFVDKNVLIPRQDTEILVEEVIKIAQKTNAKKILDLCTGSGAIAVSLAKYLPQSEITAIDISNGALKIAKKNAVSNNVENQITFISSDMFTNLNEEKFDITKINVLEILREQKEMGLKGNLYHNTQIIFAYNTNHIEGSKLTEDQTRYIYETNTILFEGQTVASVDDIIETSNHFKLVDYMIDNADKGLTEEMIKHFHRILKEGTIDSRKEWFNVGEYKKLANEAGSMKTSSPKQVAKDMQKLMEWYNSLSEVTIKDIIEFHVRFEKIHPFQDGNGRVGRIIAFKECLKNNIIPFIILDKDKLFYYRGLKEYQNKTEKGYLIDTCLNAQDQYTSMIEYYLK